MIVEWLILALYLSGILVLTFYGFHRYLMIYLYRRHVKADPPCPKIDNWPTVTVQLPLYNEQHVVARLLDAVCALDYPRDRLEIQVLDDSTDETTQVIRRLLPRYQTRGLNITHIHRQQRIGYKAGALANGLKRAKGEFIAILDADFIPEPDFLKKVIPYFKDPEVGMVQVRWDYLNRSYSLLTRIEAMMLDGHFVVEHTARYHSGRFFNFNGTGGVWRKTAIIDAGGWQHDTLTEDLDLSYRAQLKGWRFIYLKDTVVMSELPVEMAAFKQQQFRWAKGSMQTARKLLGSIFKAPIGLPRKVEAFYHLTANICYPLMLWVGMLLGPAIWARYRLGLYQFLWLDIPIFCLATISVSSFYVLSQKENPFGFHRWYHWLWMIPMLMAIGIGISISNTRAVWEGLTGVQTPFMRTPKYGIDRRRVKHWVKSRYRLKQLSLPLMELSMAMVFVFVSYFCIQADLWYSLPFVALFLVGFSYTGWVTLWQGWLIPLTWRRTEVETVARESS